MYQLLLAGAPGLNAAALAQSTADMSEHPLTVSDPLSAGVAVAPGRQHLRSSICLW